MKIREGFVSNSSSSSFIISKRKLSALQIAALYNHIQIGKDLGIEYCDPDDAWSIDEDEDTIRLSTSMDNFDMDDFLAKIEATGAVMEREHS